MFSYNKPIDPVTVIEKMREDGVWSEDTSGYIRDLMLMTPTAANALEYADIVKDKALLRNITDACHDITEMAILGEYGAMKILEAAEQRVYSLRQDRSKTALIDISKIMIDVYKHISDAAKSGDGMPGLTSGFPDLDKMLLGLNASDLIMIASRPGMGKTAIALNIALHVARKSGKQVAIFSLEMSSLQLALRLLSSSAFIDGKNLHRGRLKEEEWHRLAETAKYISETKLLINEDASLSVDEMNAQCRRLKDLGLVVIDYMQLMSSATKSRGYRSENREQVVREISRTMKVMAKELNVPIICLSQLNRESEKGKDKRKPRLSDLRESGSIEQDADIVMALYRDTFNIEDADDPNIVECLVLKNRRGETGSIPLRWVPEFTSFSSLERHYVE